MKTKYNCVKCGGNDWDIRIGGAAICRYCDYCFDWWDYTTAGELDASQITSKKRGNKKEGDN